MATKKKKVSKKKKIRIAIIGAGGMVNNIHAPSLQSFADVEMVGLCDIDKIRLNSTAKKFGIEKRYTDYHKMIDEVKPDGIYAIGQPHLLYDVWVGCLKEGVNLYIEKPLGLTWHQAQMLTELAETKGLITQVSHQRRTCPLLVKMHEECLKRGPIVHAVCEFFKCAVAPLYDPRDHMMDDCTHSIDTIRWLCGGEVIDIESHCKRIGTPDINWINATLHFDNGSTGFIVNSWSSGRRIFRVQMHSKGIYADAEVEKSAYLYADNDYEGKFYDTKDAAGSEDGLDFCGFRAKSREFIDSLKSGKEVTSSPFRDCVKTMEVAEKILALALLNGE